MKNVDLDKLEKLMALHERKEGRTMKNKRLESRLLALGCADSIAFATPAKRRKHTKQPHNLWVSIGWLAVALVAMGYVAAFAN